MQKTRIPLKKIVLVSLFAALSIVFGKILKISIGDSIRLSFENLPIILSSFCLGPIYGAFVGGVADIVGCFVAGYAINPIITFAAVLMGVLPDLISRITKRIPVTAGFIVSALVTHVICSMLVKSLGLYIYFKTPFEVLLLRVPIYLVIGTLEGYICSLVMKNKTLTKLFR